MIEKKPLKFKESEHVFAKAFSLSTCFNLPIWRISFWINQSIRAGHALEAGNYDIPGR